MVETMLTMVGEVKKWLSRSITSFVKYCKVGASIGLEVLARVAVAE